jgi:hypothetical protein
LRPRRFQRMRSNGRRALRRWQREHFPILHELGCR